MSTVHRDPDGLVGSRGRRRTRRQLELLDRLVELTAAEGFSHLTLDGFAQRLRCSKTTLYALANSRSDLVVEVIKQYFRKASATVEASIAEVTGATARVEAYLVAVSEQLRPLSRDFMDDLAAFPPAAEVYRRNTAAAAERIRQLIADGIDSGEFRSVHAAFAAEMTAATMFGIQQGDMFRRLNMSDADAYAELSSLLLHALDRGSGASSGRERATRVRGS